MGALLSAPCKVKGAGGGHYYITDKDKNFAYCNVSKESRYTPPSDAKCDVKNPCMGPVEKGTCSLDGTPIGLSCQMQQYNNGVLPVPIEEHDFKVNTLQSIDNYQKATWDFEKVRGLVPAGEINGRTDKPYVSPQDYPDIERDLDGGVSSIQLISTIAGAGAPAVAQSMAKFQTIMNYTPMPFALAHSPAQVPAVNIWLILGIVIFFITLIVVVIIFIARLNELPSQR